MHVKALDLRGPGGRESLWDTTLQRESHFLLDDQGDAGIYLNLLPIPWHLSALL